MSSHILFAEDSLALVLLSGDDFHAVSGVARSVSTDVAGSIRASANDAVQRLAGEGGGDRSGNGGAPRLCITMPDGLTVSGSAALDALRAELGDAVPIFGGTAGDQWRFKGTRQFHGTEVLQDSVPFLLFDEGVAFSFGVDTGWRPIGREGRVTESTATWCGPSKFLVPRIAVQNACQKEKERISTMPFLLWRFSPGDKIENCSAQ